MVFGTSESTETELCFNNELELMGETYNSI